MTRVFKMYEVVGVVASLRSSQEGRGSGRGVWPCILNICLDFEVGSLKWISGLFIEGR